MSVRTRLDRIERGMGPPPGIIAAVADPDGRVTLVLTGGDWTPAPAGMTVGDLSESCKVYIDIDPDGV